jgi:hypothetical protein
MRFERCCLLLSGLLLFSAGCSKREAPPVAVAPPAETNASIASVPNGASSLPVNTAPGPRPTPTAPVILTSTNNTDDVLGQLTRQLHRTMIGRKLSGSFEEFVAISHVQVPPPPAGKKYAISKKWRVVLVDN